MGFRREGDGLPVGCVLTQESGDASRAGPSPASFIRRCRDPHRPSSDRFWTDEAADTAGERRLMPSDWRCALRSMHPWKAHTTAVFGSFDKSMLLMRRSPRCKHVEYFVCTCALNRN